MRTYTEKELETLIKEVDYFKDLNDKLEADNKELTKQLALYSVSQQRKLLNALADNFNESTHTYVGQPMIEETLKAFNCG